MLTHETRGRRLTRQIHELLSRRIKTSIEGIGREDQVARAIGKRSGWLRERRHKGRIELGFLLDILDFLGLEQADFFVEALGSTKKRARFPLIVQQALKHPAKVPAADARRRYEEIDRYRYDDPSTATEQAEQHLLLVPKEALAYALGVLGSCYRIVLELEDAEAVIQAAIQLETLPSGIANLQQRLSYVDGERGAYQKALKSAESAIANYATDNDHVGVAKALVDRGIWLHYLEDWQGSLRSQLAALDGLPEGLVISRCAAHQALCSTYRHLGRLEQALEQMSKIILLSDQLPRVSAAKFRWMMASLKTDLGELEAAEADLIEVAHFFESTSVTDTALATVALVEVQLRQGNEEAAHETARSMLAKVKRLDGPPQLGRAVLTLIRHGSKGVTLERLAQTRRAIEKGRPEGRPHLNG